MSSRAIRRYQRELEAEKLRKEEAEAQDTDEDEPDTTTYQTPEKNVFDLLNSAEDNDETEEDGGDDRDADLPQTDVVAQAHDSEEEEETEAVSQQTSKKQSKKKKKKKKKGKEKVVQEHSHPAPKDDSGLDEIDLALKSLGAAGESGNDGSDLLFSREHRRFYQLLSVDRRHLNVHNEVRRVFGKEVLESTNEPEDAPVRRPGEGVSISEYLSARMSTASKGQGLSGFALRPNVFMAGKAEWPKTNSGGLGMELVEKADDFTIEYRFTHHDFYRAVQGKFERAVASYDPQQVIQMVYQNPYHIASLLQTAEIMNTDNEYAVAVDLYERALYSFGRSVHSTFASALSEGKARMDFRRPENREFWLAGWSYIKALTRQGTPRTAYEWAKLLLSLDPEGDPYCIRLVLGQLAVSAGQSQQLLDLANTKMSLVDWGQGTPNIRISLALAHYHTREVQEAKDTLAIAIKDFPWIFTRLYQELNLKKTPKSIWGVQPRTNLEKFQMESYVSRSKINWASPKLLSFLEETVEGLEKPNPPKNEDRPVSLDEARHAIVSQIPSLLGTIPRSYTSVNFMASDPLPPPDSMARELNGSAGGANGNDSTAFDSDAAEDGPGTVDDDQVRASRDAEVAANASWFEGILDRLRIMRLSQRAPAREAPEDEGLEADAREIAERSLREPAANSVQGSSSRDVHDADGGPEDELVLPRPENTLGAEPGSSDGSTVGMTGSAARGQDGEAPNRRQATVEDAEDEPEIEAALPRPAEAGGQMPVGLASREEMVAWLREGYNDDANKRWLAGRGMLALKAFVAEHGSDEARWTNDPRVDKTLVLEYLARVSMLRSTIDRDFVLNYALRQGAGAPASDLVKRML